MHPAQKRKFLVNSFLTDLHAKSSHYRSSQALVDALVEDPLKGVLPHDVQVFQDPVEDDGIANRVADDRQERGDDRQANLSVRKRVGAQGHQNVLGQGDDGRNPVFQLKPDVDVNAHADQGPNDCQGRLSSQIRARLRTDRLFTDDRKLAEKGLALYLFDDVEADLCGGEASSASGSLSRAFDGRRGWQ